MVETLALWARQRKSDHKDDGNALHTGGERISGPLGQGFGSHGSSLGPAGKQERKRGFLPVVPGGSKFIIKNLATGIDINRSRFLYYF